MTRLIVVLVVVVVLALWPPTPKALLAFLRQLIALARVIPKMKRNRTDFYRWIVRRPSLFVAVNVYETAVLLANGLDMRVKHLAELKVSSLTGCVF